MRKFSLLSILLTLFLITGISLMKAPALAISPTVDSINITSTNMYSYRQTYTLTAVCSDCDASSTGINEFHYVEIEIPGAVRIRWNQNTNTFSAISGGDYLGLLSGNYNYGGNTVTVSFEVQFNWSCPEINSANLSAYVEDDSGESAVGGSAVCSIISSIKVENFTVNDNTVNPNVPIILTGKVVYNDSNNIAVPDAYISQVAIHNNNHIIQGTSGNTNGGIFNVNINSPSICGSYTYHPNITLIGGGGGVRDFSSNTVSFTVNRIKITNITIENQKYDGTDCEWDDNDGVNDEIKITITAKWDYTGEALNSGKVKVGYQGDTDAYGQTGVFSGGQASIDVEENPSQGSIIKRTNITCDSDGASDNDYGDDVFVEIGVDNKNIGWDNQPPTMTWLNVPVNLTKNSTDNSDSDATPDFKIIAEVSDGQGSGVVVSEPPPTGTSKPSLAYRIGLKGSDNENITPYYNMTQDLINVNKWSYLIESPESSWENYGDYYITYRLRCYDNVGNFSYDLTTPPERELINNHQLHFPFTTEGPILSSPNFADLNNDGIKEIIFGSDDKKIYALKSDGTNITGWPVTLEGKIQHKVAIEDVNTDGKLEVIATCNDGKLYIFNCDGTNLSGFPQQLATGTNIITTSPAVFTSDINTGGSGPNGETFTVCTFNSKVYGFFRDKHDTKLCKIEKWWEFGNTSNNIYSSPVIGDIDSDGEVEVVVISGANVYIWWWCGTPYKRCSKVPNWVLPAESKSTPALADIDEDGDLEIFIGCDNGRVYAYHHDGSVVTNWLGGKLVGGTGSMVRSSPVVGEITNDSEPDPILEVIAASTDGQICAFNTRTGALVGKYTGANPIYSSPCIGRIENDNDRMVVIFADNNGKLYAFEPNTSCLIDRFYTEMCDTGELSRSSIASSPGILDFDNDGDIEIVVGCSNNKLYVFDYDGNTNLKSEWQMFKSDVNSTSNYNYTEKYKCSPPTICITKPDTNINLPKNSIYRILVNTYARWSNATIHLYYCPEENISNKTYIGELNTNLIEHNKLYYDWNLSTANLLPNVKYYIYGRINYNNNIGEDYSQGTIDPPMGSQATSLFFNNDSSSLTINIPENAFSEAWEEVASASKSPILINALKKIEQDPALSYHPLMSEFSWNIRFIDRNGSGIKSNIPISLTLQYTDNLSSILKNEANLRVFCIESKNTTKINSMSTNSSSSEVYMYLVKPQIIDTFNNQIRFKTNNLNAIYLPLEITPIVDTSKLTAYPVPYNPLSGQDLTIQGIPDDVENIKIYNLAGESIKTLSVSAGRVTWDGTNEHKKIVANGVYFYSLNTKNEGTVVRKIAIIKK